GTIELANVGQSVVGSGGAVPAGVKPVADKLEKAGPSPHLDQEPRNRIALAVEAHQVVRIFLDDEEPGQWQIAPSFEQVDRYLIVPVPFALILAEQRSPLIGPAGHGPAEVGGEDGVRHLVRQRRRENSVETAFDDHVLIGNTAPVETE